MEITVKLCGPLRKLVQGHHQGEMVLDLAEGATIGQAVESLGISDQVRMLMLNGRAVQDDRPLAPGDRLTLIPPQLAYNMYVATGFLAPSVRRRIKQDEGAED